MKLRGVTGICVALALLAVAGCESTNLWWEYRDDAYIADMAKKGDQEVLRNINSPNKERRQMALRILAVRAGEERRAGQREEAREKEAVIIRRYSIEKEQEVRSCIVRICAPTAGRGSTAMVMFLRERIAAGEFPGYAAMSLAYLGPRDAVLDIEPLSRHPAPEVRLLAAEALVVLGDERGFDAVARTWRNMTDALWPAKVEGVPLAEARAGLEARAIRSFGRPLQ